MKNLVILIGNVGADPVVKNFENGGKIATLSLATVKMWKAKDTGEKKEKTTWHNIQFSGPLAGIAETYIKKGMLLSIDGEIDNYQYQNEANETKYGSRINVTNMKMLGGGPKPVESTDPVHGVPADLAVSPDDDLPF